MSRKQALLARHRRNKRRVLLAGLALVLLAGVLVAWWLPLPLLLLAWVAHEAWFADHLFYSPGDDYAYSFDNDAELSSVALKGEQLALTETLDAADTVILAVDVKASWLGRLFDPYVQLLGGELVDRQTFERGVDGLRYLNLSGFADELNQGRLRLKGRFCRIVGQPRLWRFQHPDFSQHKVMVIAPHADDAELAAYGLYSGAASSWIVTLTAGEIEAEHYQTMGLAPAEAAQLKGRLRAWDSLSVPRWAGVPAEQCVQLGYFCLQLPAMQAAPEQAFGSREADMSDIRPFRQLNPFALPADADGAPTWNNLLADLRELLLQAKPDVLVMPHATIDPHPDHICAQAAVLQALQGLAHQPRYLLGYANHLHDNDRWPMGNAGEGVALPPFFDARERLMPCSLPVTREVQMDKAMALGMMHDLQPPPPFKRRVRRWLQGWLAGRRWPATGENEFFRKAVRRHELFWRKDL